MSPRAHRSRAAPPARRTNGAWGYLSTVVSVTGATIVSFAGREVLALPDIVMIYLVGITAVAARFGRWHSTFAAALSVASYDFFIVPPVFKFVVDDARHLLTFGTMFGVGLLISHLTQRLRQEEVRAREEELRSALLSSVSHDLRTPLAAMAGAATALRDAPENLASAERADLAETICEEVDRLERLIDNLLDMTRLQFGRVRPKPRWFSLDEVIDSALTRNERKLRGRSVNVNLSESTFLVFADPTLIEQVFVNLLENAAKYTPPGSPIDIVGRVTEDGWDVEVADRGPGIDRVFREKVFEKFYRGPHDDRRGAGLGLAICRGAVEAHGGSLTVEARAGGGATFRMVLPSAPDTAPSLGDPGAHSPPEDPA